MSPLVLLGSLGTLLSTISMLPHLVHAVRTRKPSGSIMGWGIGAASSMVWFAYGVGMGDLLQAAPGFITVPANLTLTVWTLVHARRSRAVVVPMPDTSVVYVPEAWEPLGYASAGDTLEMPRIA